MNPRFFTIILHKNLNEFRDIFKDMKNLFVPRNEMKSDDEPKLEESDHLEDSKTKYSEALADTLRPGVVIRDPDSKPETTHF